MRLEKQAERSTTTAAFLPRAKRELGLNLDSTSLCTCTVFQAKLAVQAGSRCRQGQFVSLVSANFGWPRTGTREGNKGGKGKPPDPGHFNVPTADRGLPPPEHHHNPQSLFLSSHYAAPPNFKALPQPPSSDVRSLQSTNPPKPIQLHFLRRRRRRTCPRAHDLRPTPSR
jgi:hypothetical protein